MKLGVVGKGGVGKTTLSALIAEAYVAAGRTVVAIDTDSNPKWPASSPSPSPPRRCPPRPPPTSGF
ncbi:MAG: ArsA-related P-loop ATPase [Acidimicrobiales bacterium]